VTIRTVSSATYPNAESESEAVAMIHQECSAIIRRHFPNPPAPVRANVQRRSLPTPHQAGLPGTWRYLTSTSSAETGVATATTTSLTLLPDGTFISEFVMRVAVNPPAGGSIRRRGRWRIEGVYLVLHLEEIDVVPDEMRKTVNESRGHEERLRILLPIRSISSRLSLLQSSGDILNYDRVQ